MKTTNLAGGRRLTAPNLLTLLLALILVAATSAQAANQFFAGDGSLFTASKWAATAAGPFTSAFTANNVVNFATVNGTGTGGSITVGGFIATENFTLTAVTGTIANSPAVVDFNVASGKTLNFAAQAFTTAVGSGYTKSGAGTLTFAGGAYGGGFTLNAGAVVATGVNAMGGNAVPGGLTINGGIIAGSAARDFSGKYSTITVGGNFQLGALVADIPSSLSLANLTFNSPIALGAATRTITIGGTGTNSLAGIISGSAGVGLIVTNLTGATGILILSNANTFSGGVTLSGGKLTLGNAAALGAAAGTLTIASGTILDSSVANLVNANNNPITINGDFTFTGSQNLNLGSGATTLGTASGTTRTIGVTNNNLTIGGAIANGTTATSITKIGLGTLALNGANTYNGGAFVNVGALSYLKTAAKPAVGTAAVAAGATLGLGVGGAGFFSATDVDSLIINSLAGVSLDAAANAGIDTTAGDFTYGSSLTSARGLVKLGNNALILSANNSGSAGAMTVAAGTLRVGAANNFTAGTLTLLGASLTATLDLLNDSSTAFNKSLILDGSANTSYIINVDRTTGAGAGGTHTLGTISQASAIARTLTVTGANGYGLTITNFSLCPGNGQGTTLVANTNVTLLDVSNPESGFGSGNFDTFTLSGTAVGCLVSGVIEDASGLSSGGTVANLVNGGTTRLTKSGTGTWTLSGANLYSGITTVTAGTLALSGSGTLGNGQAALTVSGGILDLGGSSQTVSNVTISGGTITNGTVIGAVYAGQSGTVSAVLAGTGVAMNKTTAGTLTLSSNNTYSGNTTISGGKLVLGPSGSFANSPLITVAATATNDVSLVTGGFQLGASQTLAGSGIVTGAVTAVSGAIFLPGGAGVVGTLSLSNTVTLNANTLVFDLPSSGANDLMILTSPLVLNGVSTIKLNLLNGTLPAGIYTLMTYPSSSGVGSFTLAGNYRNTTLTVGTTSVTLTVALTGAGANLTWLGGGSNPWDINTSALWTNGVSMDTYFEGDRVTMDDTGSESPALNLTTTLNPSSVTVSNVTKNYTFAGAGSLAGTASLTKSGTGSLTLSTVNTHTGPTTLLDGTLTVSGAGTLGGATGALNVNGGILDLAATSQTKGAVSITNSTIQNGTLTGTAFTVASGTVSAVLAGTGATLLKTNAGTLLFTADNTYSGLTSLGGGILQIGNGGTTGSLGSGNLTTTAAGTLLVYNRSDSVTINNRILQAAGTTQPRIQVNSGTVTLAGTVDNDGLSAVVTNGTTLILAKTSGPVVHSLGSASFVYSGSTLRLGGTGDDQFFSGVSLTLSGGTLDLAGRNESLASLSGFGTFANSGGGSPAFTNTSFVTVSNGTLSVTGGTLQANTNIIITGGATLDQAGGTIKSDAATVVNGTLSVQSGTYTSLAVAVNAGGVLTGNGTVNSAVTVAGTGKLVPGNTGVGTNTVNALTLSSGAILEFEITDATTLDKVVVTTSGGLTINGGGINLYNPSTTTPFTTNGTYDLFQYSGSIGGTGIGALALANAQGGKTYTFGLTGTMVQVTIADVPPNFWNLATGGSWFTGGNWTALAAPNGVSSAANFGGGGTAITAPSTVTLDGSYTVGAMSFSNAVNSFTIVPGSPAGTLTLDNSSAAATITDLAGNHTNAVPVLLPAAGVNVSVAAASTLDQGGAVSGAGALTKSGVGNLTLSAVNAHTGGTIVNAGTLAMNIGGTLGAAAVAVNANGGTLDLGTTTQTVGPVTIAGGTIANGILTGTSLLGQSGAVSASLAGGVPLSKTTAGSLTLSGANAYTGGTAISGGQLNVTGSGTLGNPAGALGVTNSTLDLGGTSQTVGAVTITNGTIQNGILSGTAYTGQSGTVNAVLAGGGALTKTTAGTTLTLGAVNTYSGGTIVSDGNLDLLAVGNALPGNVQVDGTGRVRLAAANQIPDTAVITFGLNSAGRFQLEGFNETIEGVQDPAGGTGNRIVESANDGESNKPGTLTLAGSGTYGFAGFVRNAAGGATNSVLSITKNGVGTQTFSGVAGNVSYSGPTIINNGLLEFSGASSVANNSAITLGGGTVRFSGGGSRSNTIAGNGTVLKTGNNTLTLSGANSYTGTTIISNTSPASPAAACIVIVSNSAAFGASAVIIASNVTRLVIADGLMITNNITITGTTNGASGRGLLENSGAGNATLTNGTLTISGPVSAGALLAAPSGTLTLAGPINATVPFGQRVGTVIYSGGGSYTNNTVTGTAKLGANNGLSTQTLVDIGVSGAGTLDLAGYNQTLVGITRSTTTAANTATITNSATSSDSTLTQTGTSVYTGQIKDAGVAGSRISLVINGGSLTLTNVNTYSGTTTITNGSLIITSLGSLAAGSAVSVLNAGTLAGNGTVNGPVTVNAGGFIAPGSNAIATLTLGTAPTLGGTLLMEINRNGGAPLADKLTGVGALGGTLTVNNIGLPIQLGDAFDLLDGSLSGAFTTVNLPGGPAHWDTSALNTTGIITYINTAPTAKNFDLGVIVGGSTLGVIIGKQTSDADGDTLTITTTGGSPTNGTVSIVGGTNILYTSTNGVGPDSFTYTVGDGFTTTTATVTVNVTADSVGFNLLSDLVVNGAVSTIKYAGIPGYNYALDTTPSLTPPITWTPVITNTAAANGQLNYSFDTVAPPAFFRTRYVP